MTPLQEHYLNKLNSTCKANLEFFKKNLPHLYKQLTEEIPNASIDISDQGDLYLHHPDGTKESIAKHVLCMEQKLHDFDKISIRPQLIGFQNLRKVQVGDIGHGDRQSFHYSNLDAYYPNLVKEHFVEHYPDSEGLLKYPEFGGKTIPILIVVGCGFGWHLMRLLMEYDIRHMIIIDTSIERFRQSIYFQDYVELSRLAIEKGTSLSFEVKTNIEEITQTVVHLVQISLPPCFVHGAGLFYAVNEDESLDEIKKTLPITLWQVFFGLGYFDDELVSIRHTFENFKKNIPIYSRPNVVPPDAVAFIIGSGPSLDDLKPLLEKYSDRAVLFSCGTSILSLFHDDICPDFHVEKERPNIVHEMLTETVSEEFLKRINFIGGNVTYPKVFDLFKSAGMVFKTADTVVNLLQPQEIRNHPVISMQPTVTNAALNIAISLGFKTIYLVGVDFGYVDKAKHHSEHTIYFKNIEEEGRLKTLFSKKKKSNFTARGNFGGVIYSTNIFNVARVTMENDIRAQPGPKIYNLNNGAYIDGATPLTENEVYCDCDANNKFQTVQAITDAFQAQILDTDVLGARLLDQISNFIEDVEEMLLGSMTCKAEVLQKMVNLYKIVFSVQIIRKPVNPLFRGSILHMMALSYQVLSMIADEGEAAAKSEYDFGLIYDLLQNAKSIISDNLGHIRDIQQVKEC